MVLFSREPMNHAATTIRAASLGLSAIIVVVVSAAHAPRGF
jgi:hypothetical protein